MWNLYNKIKSQSTFILNVPYFQKNIVLFEGSELCTLVLIRAARK
jgi:hypothetical protein